MEIDSYMRRALIFSRAQASSTGLVCFFVFWLFSTPVFSDERPKGIYVAYGRVLNENILRAPYLEGVLVRVPWRDIEPSEGRYDWSYLHREIKLAQQHGKKVALAVSAGPNTPDWVYVAGAESFGFTFMNPHSPRGGQDERIPLPWDRVFLTKWTRTIAALGREFGGNPAINLVHVTGSSKNGFELQLPDDPMQRRFGSPPGPWVQRGFDSRKFVSSWTEIIDAFGRAFPDKFLDLEVHPVLGESDPAAELVDYGFKKYGKRFGAFGAWLSGRDLAWDAGIRGVMAKQCRKSFCNYQLIANGTRQSHRLGEGGLIGAIQTGVDQGARYFEVWEADVRNPNYDAALEKVARMLMSN
jgi:hypothetical protein